MAMPTGSRLMKMAMNAKAKASTKRRITTTMPPNKSATKNVDENGKRFLVFDLITSN